MIVYRIAAAIVVPWITISLLLVPGGRWLKDRQVQAVNSVGERIPTGAGVLLMPAVTLGLLVSAAGMNNLAPIILAAVCGFAVLGFIDDVLAPPDGPRGWRGHLRALVSGQISTGALKLIGGAAVAGTIAVSSSSTPLWWLIDTIVIAGSADLLNLVDTRPGRAIVLTMIGSSAALFGTAAAVTPLYAPAVTWPGTLTMMAAAGGFYGSDVKRVCMLGDAGAYLLGGGLGAILVTGTDVRVRLWVAVFIVGVELLSLVVSIRQITDRACSMLLWAPVIGREHDDK